MERRLHAEPVTGCICVDQHVGSRDPDRMSEPNRGVVCSKGCAPGCDHVAYLVRRSEARRTDEEPPPTGADPGADVRAESARLRILTAEEERRRAGPRYRSRLAIALDLNRRLRALGYWP